MNEPDAPPSSLSLSFLEDLYAEYLRDPTTVSEQWRRYFDRLDHNGDTRPANGFGPSFRPPSLFNPSGDAAGTATASRDGLADAQLQDRVDQFVRAFRVRGHRVAKIDPLDLPRVEQPELDPEFYGFTESDMDRRFSTDTIQGAEILSLGEIHQRLRNTYCRSIGVQFMHMDELPVRLWLQRRMEGTENRLQLQRHEQLRILKRLTDAVVFEEFVQRKYVGAKSFSLEGGESLIPLLDLAIEKAGGQGVQQIVLAMAHRGRLNVLANIMGKRPREIFREFNDSDPDFRSGRGDVKYHLGYSTEWVTAAGQSIHMSLCFNPSHLEFVNPVALGRVRAKQDRAGDAERKRGLAILIHGDAAMAGEGVVQESFNLSQLAGYTIGGALHVVVNNQIGFTTSPEEARSSPYATDVGKMLQIPIFHVNGEDPEAVAQVVQLAMDFRQEFGRDVVIDMYCYRRRGHNEGDEPAFTQPILYDAINRRKSVRAGYLDHLLSCGDVTREEADQMADERSEQLEEELSVARSDERLSYVKTLQGVWNGFRGGPLSEAPQVETGVPAQRLSALCKKLIELPEGFQPHPKIERILDGRGEMAAGQRPLDWATAEALAIGSLGADGFRIRMSGQDCQRGTFSHRHAVVLDVNDGRKHLTFASVAKDPAAVEVINSPLTETAVLGFEYGYSLDWPDGLIMWEAQFGDFWNAAQVIVDQFIASAEDKWRRLSGLVLLLPHGFEGMGPEHSSARLERLLQLAAEDNVQIVNLTTPAQYFHCLRRQVLSPWRKPLVVMAPKSLLRHPAVVSTLEECATGRFQYVIPDTSEFVAGARRLLLCSGKIYYDLLDERKESGRDDVSIVRIEQLYPLPEDALRDALSEYQDETPAVWVQEEPENMGAWRYLWAMHGPRLLDRFPLSCVSRLAAPSPASGSGNRHRLEQCGLLAEAFNDV